MLTSSVDRLAALVDVPVGMLPPEVSEVVRLPLFAVALLLVMVLLVRKGVIWASKLLDHALRGVATGLACAALTVLVVPTVAFRAADKPVPTLICNVDDSIASAADWTLNSVRSLSAGFTKLARLHIAIVLLLSALMFYAWNEGQCGTDSESCTKPVQEWAATVSE